MKRLVALVLTIGILLAIPQSAYAKPLTRVVGNITCFTESLRDYDNDGVEELCRVCYQFNGFDGDSTNRPDTGSFIYGYKDVATGKWVKDPSYQAGRMTAVRLSEPSLGYRAFSFDVTYADGRVEHYCGSDYGKGYEHDSLLQMNIYVDHEPSVAFYFPLTGGDVRVY